MNQLGKLRKELNEALFNQDFHIQFRSIVGFKGLLQKVDSTTYFGHEFFQISVDESKVPLVSPAASGDNCGIFAMLRCVGFDRVDLSELENTAKSLRHIYGLPEGPLDAETLVRLFTKIFPSENLVVVTIQTSGDVIEPSYDLVVIVNTATCADYSLSCEKADSDVNFLVLINCGEMAHYYYVEKRHAKMASHNEVIAGILESYGIMGCVTI